MSTTARGLLKHLPNALTALRLLLAFPLGVLIIRGEFEWALGVGLACGLSDAVDGIAARRLGVVSRVGAVLDPIADKMLIIVSFLSLAWVGLIPAWLALVVVLRDVVIVSGALTYHRLIGRIEMAPRLLSKLNMGIQSAFCLAVFLAEVWSGVPRSLLDVWGGIAAVVAVLSGVDYVVVWTRKAMREYDARRS